MKGAKEFQEDYWAKGDQRPTFRHQAALDMIKEGPVLDIGTGGGLMLDLLRERGIDGEGIDLSDEAIAQAKKKGLTARSHDIAHTPLPYKSSLFRYALLLDVLEHLFQPRHALQESLRVGREVIVAVPNFSFLLFRFQALLGLVPTILSPRKGHVYYFTQDTLERLINDVGAMVQERRYYFPLMERPLIGWLTRQIGRLRPQLFSTSFVYRLRKK